jgi:hypothetical protein
MTARGGGVGGGETIEWTTDEDLPLASFTLFPSPLTLAVQIPSSQSHLLDNKTFAPSPLPFKSLRHKIIYSIIRLCFDKLIPSQSI